MTDDGRRDCCRKGKKTWKASVRQACQSLGDESALRAADAAHREEAMEATCASAVARWLAWLPMQ